MGTLEFAAKSERSTDGPGLTTSVYIGGSLMELRLLTYGSDTNSR